MKLKNIIIIAVAVIVVFLVTLSIDLFNQNKKHLYSSEMIASPVVDELVAYRLHLPEGKQVTPQEVSMGVYPVEAVEIAPNKYVIDTPRRIGRFWKFDMNKDGVINQDDLIYKHLAVAYINLETKTIRFVSWRDAGIVAMALDPGHLTAEKSESGLPTGFWKVHSTVILTDGSQSTTQHVALPSSVISELSTAEGSGQTFVPPVR